MSGRIDFLSFFLTLSWVQYCHINSIHRGEFAQPAFETFPVLDLTSEQKALVWWLIDSSSVIILVGGFSFQPQVPLNQTQYFSGSLLCLTENGSLCVCQARLPGLLFSSFSGCHRSSREQVFIVTGVPLPSISQWEASEEFIMGCLSSAHFFYRSAFPCGLWSREDDFLCAPSLISLACRYAHLSWVSQSWPPPELYFWG